LPSFDRYEYRSGSRRTVESYGRMLWPFFADLRKTPDRVKPADVLAWVHGIGKSRSSTAGVTGATRCTGPSGTRSRRLWPNCQTATGSGPSTYRAKLLALPAAIAVAPPARREELCRVVVEKVVVNDRNVEEIVWTPPARPFVGRQRLVPPRGLGDPPAV